MASEACGCAPYSETLVQSEESWNGKKYEKYPEGVPQLTVVRMTIPARTSLPWHTHPMPNAAYILSGQMTVEELATGRTKTIRAGEAFPESVDDTHRGTTGEEETVVIVTYASVAGLPLSVPTAEDGAQQYMKLHSVPLHVPDRCAGVNSCGIDAGLHTGIKSAGHDYGRALVNGFPASVM